MAKCIIQNQSNRSTGFSLKGTLTNALSFNFTQPNFRNEVDRISPSSITPLLFPAEIPRLQTALGLCGNALLLFDSIFKIYVNAVVSFRIAVAQH